MGFISNFGSTSVNSNIATEGLEDFYNQDIAPEDKDALWFDPEAQIDIYDDINDINKRIDDLVISGGGVEIESYLTDKSTNNKAAGAKATYDALAQLEQNDILFGDKTGYFNLPIIYKDSYPTIDGIKISSGFRCNKKPLIISNATLLRVENAKPFRFWFYSDESATIGCGNNTTGEYIEGSKSLRIAFRDSENIDGYPERIIVINSNHSANIDDIPCNLFLRYNNETNVQVNSKFCEDYDLGVLFRNKGVNGLIDFMSFFKLASETFKKPSNKINTDNIGFIYGGSNTEWLSPVRIIATNNEDGDFPYSDYNNIKITGGWHGYDNATSLDVSATAREVSKKVYADNKVLSVGEYAYCNTMRILVTNRVQGSNTQKADGSGREIIEQTFDIRYDGKRFEIYSEIKALEDIKIHTLRGISFSNFLPNVRLIGADTTKFGVYDKSTILKANCTINGVKQFNDTMYLKMMIVESLRDIDKSNVGCILSSGKSYIQTYGGNNNNDLLMLNNGDIVSYSGYYEIGLS